MKLHWNKPDKLWFIVIQAITYLPVKLGCTLKQNYLMSSNFYFTYRQVVHMPILALSCLPSSLSDSIWITATDSPHVNTASGAWLGFWFIPCPSRISPSWLGAADFWRLAEHRGSARILTPATDAWTDTRSPHPHWHEPPSWPSGASRASASQVTPRTRLRDSPPLRPSELASPLLHPPLHLPHQQWVTLCHKLSSWDADASCSE